MRCDVCQVTPAACARGCTLRTRHMTAPAPPAPKSHHAHALNRQLSAQQSQIKLYPLRVQITQSTRPALLGACPAFMLRASPSHTRGAAQAMCQSYGAYMENASQLQRQQTPSDVALRIVSRVRQRQPRLAIRLEDSVAEVYCNSAGMVDALRSGRLQQMCERHLKVGY
jgi:hypothetical protein